MSHMTSDQNKLVKARKAARAAFALFIMIGAILICYGILTAYLPTLMNGLVFIAASVLPFFVSKTIEKKLNKTLA